MKQAHSWRSSWPCGYRAGSRPAVRGLPHNREGEVKTRLTIGNSGDFWPRSGKKSQKRETPVLSNRGLGRRGRCRVPPRPPGLLNDLAVQGEIEALALHFFGAA